jgi:hypothetical protein
MAPGFTLEKNSLTHDRSVIMTAKAPRYKGRMVKAGFLKQILIRSRVQA